MNVSSDAETFTDDPNTLSPLHFFWEYMITFSIVLLCFAVSMGFALHEFIRSLKEGSVETYHRVKKKYLYVTVKRKYCYYDSIGSIVAVPSTFRGRVFIIYCVLEAVLMGQELSVMNRMMENDNFFGIGDSCSCDTTWELTYMIAIFGFLLLGSFDIPCGTKIFFSAKVLHFTGGVLVFVLFPISRMVKHLSLNSCDLVGGFLSFLLYSSTLLFFVLYIVVRIVKGPFPIYCLF